MYDNPNYFILLDITSIIIHVEDHIQGFKEGVKIKKHIHIEVTLSRNNGNNFLSPIHDEITNSDPFYIR